MSLCHLAETLSRSLAGLILVSHRNQARCQLPALAYTRSAAVHSRTPGGATVCAAESMVKNITV